MKKPVSFKNGSRVKTRLCGGRQVDKDGPQIEAVGCLDELNSFLGLVRAQEKQKRIVKIIEDIQKDLFLLGREIAAEDKLQKKLSNKISRKEVGRLDELMAGLEKRLDLKKQFYLPGKTLKSARIDIARAVARRAERKVTGLSKDKLLTNPAALDYLNRLSDFLFLLARLSELKK